MSFLHFLTIPVLIVLIYFLWKLLRDEALFVPLPMNTVRKILEYANPSEKDVLYDLGSGDGRVIIEASKKYGCRSVGVEKNRLLCWITQRKIKKEKLEEKIKIVNSDIFECKIDDATIVIMYLSHRLTQELKGKLKKELKKGTRIFSASHPIEGWKPVKKFKTGHFYTYEYVI